MGDTVGVCCNEMDFIDYLNQYICDERSSLIETLQGLYREDRWPEE